MRYVNNEGATQWSTKLGASGKAHSVGYSVIEGANAFYVGIGLWQSSTKRQMPAVVALDKATGKIIWTTVLGSGTSKHGGVRSCIMDGQEIVCAGYVNYQSKGGMVTHHLIHFDHGFQALFLLLMKVLQQFGDWTPVEMF